MQLFRVPPYLPLLVLTCWAVLQGVSGSCSADSDCHSGTCDTGTSPSTCDCTGTGFDGDNCETDINECEATGVDVHECDTNAACTNTPPGSYSCTCNEGFAGNGKTCIAGVCSDGGNECANGGTCVTTSNPTTCTCTEGYTGNICDTDINECEATGVDAHKCDTNAACTNTPPGSYTCTCNEGFAGNGKTCTEGVCSDGGNECDNGGTCVTSTTPTTCTCAEGYTGDTCQSDGDTVKISTFLMTLTFLTFFVIP